MEALYVFEAERKRHRKQLESLKLQRDEVGRNVVSGFAASLSRHLDQAQTETVLLFNDFALRLFHSLEILRSNAELIPPTSEILLASGRSTLVEDRTDNLILTSILEHAKNHPSETRIFLSENRKDFDSNNAKSALRGVGVRYFADASKFLEWHRAQPDLSN
jgi:hypothetical protein